MLTVTVEHPDYPDGFELGIVGLGMFKNGEAREVTESQEKAFVSFYQVDAAEKLGESEMITVTGTTEVTNLEDVLGKDVSDRPSPDPTAMNIDPHTGEVFEFANLGGASTDPDEVAEEEEVVEKETPKTTTTITSPEPTTIISSGGDN